MQKTYRTICLWISVFTSFIPTTVYADDAFPHAESNSDVREDVRSCEDAVRSVLENGSFETPDMEIYTEFLLAILEKELGNRAGLGTTYAYNPFGNTREEDPEFGYEGGVRDTFSKSVEAEAEKLDYYIQELGIDSPYNEETVQVLAQSLEYGTKRNASEGDASDVDFPVYYREIRQTDKEISLSDISHAWAEANDTDADPEYYVSATEPYIIVNPKNGTVGEMPYYAQSDYRGTYFNGGSVASDGCGITSAAMVISFLTGEEVTPDDTAEMANKDGGYNTVKTHKAFERFADAFGLQMESMAGPSRNCCHNPAYDPDYLEQCLKAGEAVICSGNNGYFYSSGGHYIALFGWGKNGPYVYDPGSKDKHEESMEDGGTDLDTIMNGVKHIFIFSREDQE